MNKNLCKRNQTKGKILQTLPNFPANTTQGGRRRVASQRRPPSRLSPPAQRARHPIIVLTSFRAYFTKKKPEVIVTV